MRIHTNWSCLHPAYPTCEPLGGGGGGGGFFLACKDFRRMFARVFFFFKDEIGSRALIPLFMPGSIHSGSPR